MYTWRCFPRFFKFSQKEKWSCERAEKSLQFIPAEPFSIDTAGRDGVALCGVRLKYIRQRYEETALQQDLGWDFLAIHDVTNISKGKEVLLFSFHFSVNEGVDEEWLQTPPPLSQRNTDSFKNEIRSAHRFDLRVATWLLLEGFKDTGEYQNWSLWISKKAWLSTAYLR